MGVEESFNGSLEFFVIENFRKSSFHGSFAIMLDAHAVAESDQEFFLTLHEPDLEEVFSDGVAGLKLKGFVHPGDLINDGFLFDKNGTELTIRGEAGDGSFVESAVVFPEPLEHVRDEGGINGLVDFV